MTEMCKKSPEFPVPNKESFYSWAKKAEYIERDLVKAEKYYRKAIRKGERTASAVKDLASVLHQQGKTKNACELLDLYRPLFFKQKASYRNLLLSLQKQLNPTGTSLNKHIRVSGLPVWANSEFVKCLFGDISRLRSLELNPGTALLKFASHSAARKTVETYLGEFTLEWMSVDGTVSGQARNKPEFSLFSKGSQNPPVVDCQFVSYFCPLKTTEFADHIEEILNYSILSYKP